MHVPPLPGSLWTLVIYHSLKLDFIFFLLELEVVQWDMLVLFPSIWSSLNTQFLEVWSAGGFLRDSAFVVEPTGEQSRIKDPPFMWRRMAWLMICDPCKNHNTKSRKEPGRRTSSHTRGEDHRRREVEATLELGPVQQLQERGHKEDQTYFNMREIWKPVVGKSDMSGIHSSDKNWSNLFRTKSEDLDSGDLRGSYGSRA